MNFRVGMKVVCIRAKYAVDAPPPLPKVGTVATVSWIGFCKEFADDGCGGQIIDLVELPSPETEKYYRGYAAANWRPLVERKTDISIFRKMLTPNQETING